MPRGKAQQAGMDFEERFAELLGAKIQPGSGNQWWAKLDVGDRTILWSLKHTGKDSIKITKGLLEEAIREATKIGSVGMMPGLAVDVAGEEFVMLRANDFAALLQEEVKVFRPTKAAAKRALADTPLILRDNENNE